LKWAGEKSLTFLKWKTRDVFFFSALIGASFLPYFQHLPSGKTFSSYQYYFIYFSFPFLWLALIVGLFLRLEHQLVKHTRILIACSVLVGITAQMLLFATPSWMIARVLYDKRQQPIYDHLSALPFEPVVLSPGISYGSSQDLILRSKAWSFVPHPMMYCYGSIAPTTELIERQLLAKLLLTGKVSDLAPVFSEKGLIDYPQFYHQSSKEIQYWLDRLENCPARSYFLFHPSKSLKDFEVRGLEVPAILLQQNKMFAYFGFKNQNIFRKVQKLESLDIDQQIHHIRQYFRLSHILLVQPDTQFANRLRYSSKNIKLEIEALDGSSLWSLLEDGRSF
jgi:hypothetical protein